MPKAYGERIVLREYRKEDLPYIHEWVNNPKITDMLSDFIFPHTLNRTENFLEAMLKTTENDLCGFVIAYKDTEEYLGQIDFIKIDWKNRRALMGMIIGKEEYHNKGYGTEAMKLLLEYGFNRLGLNKVELEVRAYNKKALRCYEKCGFKVEGVFRQDFFIHGEFTDTIRMGILKTEWNSF